MEDLDARLQSIGLQPLTWGDEPLFRSFVKSHRPVDNDDIKDSWAYTLQATRNLPMKYFSEDILVLLTVKDDRSAIVIPNYFVPSEQQLADVVKILCSSTGLPVVLKNVDDTPEAVNKLRAFGFSPYAPGERWDADSRYDDQTYPQAVLDLNKLAPPAGFSQPLGPAYYQLRKRLKHSSNLKITFYDQQKDYAQTESLLHAQAESRDNSVYAANHLFLVMPPSANAFSLTFSINGQALGFSLLDRISDTTAAWNSIIYDRRFSPNLSSRITFESAMFVKSRGFTKLNLQGSETAGLNQWKKTFVPCRQIPKTHLIYRA